MAADVIVLDDRDRAGSTVLALLERLRERNVRSIRTPARTACSRRRPRAPRQPADVLEIVCTNTVPIPIEKRVAKLKSCQSRPRLAEAMRRIHNGESVSALFHPA